MYSFTFNPIDKYQYFGKFTRLHDFKCFLKNKILENLCCDYTFVIEISEPRGMHTQGYKGPRLHIHGVLTFLDKKQLGEFLLTTHWKLLNYGSVDIDTCEDWDVWMQYMLKQQILSDKYKFISNCTELSSSGIKPDY